MKKVCILQNGLLRGGTDTFVRNLSRGLDKSKYQITIVNPLNASESVIGEDELIADGISIYHTTPLNSLKNKIMHLRQLYKFLKKEKFDVFQTNIDLFNGPNLLVAKLAGVPVRCCHSHNTLQNKELRLGRTFSVRSYQALMRWLCWNFSNRRCGCSRDAMDFLYKDRKWEDSAYPQIINNGIDLKKFSKKIDVENKKKELNLNPNKKHIVTIGHLIDQKNPLFIAQLFSDLCKKNNDTDLVWIGKGPLKEQVLEILRKGKCVERVHFLENRNDVDEILKCCDIFILPSNFEGLGIVAIEAQAAGLPSLVSDKVPAETDCGAVKYLTINQGTEIWIETIDDIISSKLSLKIDEKKLNEFSIENMVKQMSEVFVS